MWTLERDSSQFTIYSIYYFDGKVINEHLSYLSCCEGMSLNFKKCD